MLTEADSYTGSAPVSSEHLTTNIGYTVRQNSAIRSFITLSRKNADFCDEPVCVTHISRTTLKFSVHFTCGRTCMVAGYPLAVL